MLEQVHEFIIHVLDLPSHRHTHKLLCVRMTHTHTLTHTHTHTDRQTDRQTESGPAEANKKWSGPERTGPEGAGYLIYSGRAQGGQGRREQGI